MCIEDTVRKILEKSVIKNESIMPFLEAAKTISDQRGVVYGFEWIIHIAIAKYVIDNADKLNISNIQVNKKIPGSGVKPDLTFEYKHTPTYFEFKTFDGNSYSYIKPDVNKLRQMTGNRFVVACGYRSHKRDERVPNWDNAKIWEPFIINNDFRLVVIEVN